MTDPAAISPRKLRLRDRIVVPLARAYIRLIFATTRWQHQGSTWTRQAMAHGEPLIITFWHGRMLIMPVLKPRDYRASMLISNNKHGTLVAEIIRIWNAPAIRGSARNPRKLNQDKGGREALAEIKRTTQAGQGLGITPDGPRGPRMRVQKGVVTVAQMTGLPVCSVTFATRWRWIARSWDRHHIALPFGSGTIVWSDPITVDRRGDAEAARLKIETAMIEATRQADLACGHTPVEPDPAETR